MITATAIRSFAVHQWRQALRSPYWHRSLAVKIVLGLFTVILLLNFLGLGLVLDHILESAFPEEDVVSTFNSFLLYFFGIDLFLRFLLQKLPILPVQHYLRPRPHYLPFGRAEVPGWGVGALALLGAVGLLSSRVWLGLLTDRLRRQKYTIAAVFRIG